mmetsp:Transcript_9462/g.17072  ORF Transcript_9462/g.17072 Transcript_9462/m.17072 type:complete len:283 (+) Transcript_9462:41-889(+)
MPHALNLLISMVTLVHLSPFWLEMKPPFHLTFISPKHFSNAKLGICLLLLAPHRMKRRLTRSRRPHIIRLLIILLLLQNLIHCLRRTRTCLLHLLQIQRHLQIGNLLRQSSIRRGIRHHRAPIRRGTHILRIALLVRILGGVLVRDGEHPVILLSNLRQSGMHVGTGGAIGVGGDGGIVAFFVSVVRGGVFLLLEGDGEAEVAIFLGEVGIVEAGHCGVVGGGAGVGCASVVHVDIVRVGGFRFFAHDVGGIVLWWGSWSVLFVGSGHCGFVCGSALQLLTN